MGQNYPYLPNGQPGSFPKQNLLAQLAAQQSAAQPGATLPSQPGIQGVDPAMMAAAQQSVANPNNDLLDILPGPQDMALGIGAGAVTGLVLKQLEQNNFTNRTAEFLDQLPGVKNLSQSLDRKLEQSAKGGLLSKYPSLAEIVITPALSVKPNASPQEIHQAVAESMKMMEHRQTQLATAESRSRFNEAERTAYQNLMKQEKQLQKLHQEKLLERYAKIGETKAGLLSEDDIRKQIQKLNPDIGRDELARKARQGLQEQGRAYLATQHPSVETFLKETKPLHLLDEKATWLKNPKQANLNNLIATADAKIAYIESLGDKATKEQRHIAKYLGGLRERASGLYNHYGPIYQSQAEIAATLKANGVGPVGRMFGSTMNYLKRIFNGETFKTGPSVEKAGMFGGLGGTMFAGMLIFGQSFKKARDAQDGEKIKTFFHDFIGSGLFNFIGWEIGRKVLNGAGIFHMVPKMLPFLKSSKRPFNNRVFRYIPFIGEGFGNGVRRLLGENVFGRVLGSILGRGAGGFVARLTLGGLATELIAMLVIGGLFQKVGEKLAHLIFGKPSEASLEGKSKKQQNQANPMQPNAAGIPNGQASAKPQGMPTTGVNLQSGFFPQNTGAQPFQRNSYPGTQPGFTPAMPSYQQASGFSQAGMQAPIPTPVSPIFSISPDQIRRSPAAAAQTQNFYNQFQTNVSQ